MGAGRVIGDVRTFLDLVIGVGHIEVHRLDQEEYEQDQEDHEGKRLMQPKLQQLCGKPADHAAARSFCPLLPKVEHHLGKIKMAGRLILEQVDHIGKQYREDQRRENTKLYRHSPVKQQDKARKHQADRRKQVTPFPDHALESKRYKAEKAAFVKKAYDHDGCDKDQKNTADLTP